MKNRIKKILLLGMTAMFTAGAAGTAVSSCPVWADQAENPGENGKDAEENSGETVQLLYSSSLAISGSDRRSRIKAGGASENVHLWNPQFLNCKRRAGSIQNCTGTGRL